MGILRNSVHYLAGSIAAKLLASAKLFLLAKLIHPEDFGLYIAAITFQGLSPIMCLGAVETMLKEVPFFLGRGDNERAARIERTVLACIILAAVALVVLEGLVELLPGSFGVAGSPLISRLAVAVSIASLFTAFHAHRCAAREAFSAAAIITFVQALALLVGVLCCAWLGQGPGAVTGLALAETVAAVFAFRYSKGLHGRVVPVFCREDLLHAVRVGFPITLVWWVYMVHVSLGRICAGLLLDTTAVGLYGFATSTAMVFSMIPNVIGRVIYPRINKTLGASPTPGAIAATVLEPTRLLALLWPFFQILLWFALPAAYQMFFQEYLPSLPATYVLILASFFGVLVRNGANYLIATSHQARMLAYVLASMSVNLAVSFSLVRGGGYVGAIATGSFCAMLTLALLIWRQAFVLLQLTRRQMTTNTIRLAFPLILVAGILAVVEVLLLQTSLRGLLRGAVGGAAATAAYAGALLAFRPVRRDIVQILILLLGLLPGFMRRRHHA